ncbi:MAG: hypothetical protein J7K21_03460 [Desulfurococcales archaeon]|nr:hypothetical protein [Desulfurococcales archaeon]
MEAVSDTSSSFNPFYIIPLLAVFLVISLFLPNIILPNNSSRITFWSPPMVDINAFYNKTHVFITIKNNDEEPIIIHYIIVEGKRFNVSNYLYPGALVTYVVRETNKPDYIILYMGFKNHDFTRFVVTKEGYSFIVRGLIIYVGGR